MALLNRMVNIFTSKRLKQIELFCEKPAQVQEKVFQYLIKNGKETVFGHDFGFSNIGNSYEKFKQTVPVSEYNDLTPYIDRVRGGEKNVLWNTSVKWIAKSSGTTSSKSKYIPVTKEALENCHYRGGKDMIAIHASNYPESNFMKGKGLAIGGSRQPESNDRLYYGDISAVIMNNLPAWANFKRTPDKKTALMPEWEAKLNKMAEITSKENVSNLSGVPSWTLVVAKKVLEITGKKTLPEVWNNLEFFAHGGVNFNPYREEFKRLIPSERMKYMEVYNASEGFFALQNDLAVNDMLLMLDLGVFYEFIPVSEVNKKFPNSVTIDDVELNKNYALVISTNAGLWRYLIGDTIMFTHKYPHKIIITGRTKHFINAFGEEVIIDNAEKAINAACNATKAVIKEYHAAPVYMQKGSTGAHEWIVEFETEPTDLELFTLTLDKTLQSINSDYEAKRYRNYNLRMPIIRKAKKDLFYHWLKKRGKLGGQNKVPRLANNRKIINELLDINKSL